MLKIVTIIYQPMKDQDGWIKVQENENSENLSLKEGIQKSIHERSAHSKKNEPPEVIS